MKKKEKATILSQECLCEGVFSMWISCNAADTAAPGQFLLLYPGSDSRLLPRPISICEIDDQASPGRIRLVYRVAGGGTKEFSALAKGDGIELTGPAGNGFFAAAGDRIKDDTKALLIGGGIGIPPLVELGKQLCCDVTTVAGYRSKNDVFLTKELEASGKLLISTDDGSLGTKGTVMDAVSENKTEADIIFACGPLPMLRGVKKYAKELGIPAYISMEERMACGIGACLGCVVDTTVEDEHSKVCNRRVCADGPVFDASEVLP